MHIPVIGLTGEKWSGKTLFASSVDPHNALMIDLESSSDTYNIPFKKRYNLYEEVLKMTEGRQPTAVDCFLWFNNLIQGIKPGEYSNIIVDPISDIEAGLTLWVQANPGVFGHTANQYERASGIMWGDLQAKWKLDLGIVASKVQSFIFTAHLGSVWGTDGRPQPGKTKPKGKSVLMELASMYLQFERKPDQKGAIPDKPVARVLKSRLATTEFIDGEMKFWPVLPASVPDCDPNKIRWYIQNPVSKRSITEQERAAPEVQLTEDERLLLRSQIVGETLQIEEKRSSRLELMRQAAQQTQSQVVKQVQTTRTVTETTGVVPQQEVAQTQPAATATTAEAPKRTRRTKEQIAADEAAAKAAKDAATPADTVVTEQPSAVETTATTATQPETAVPPVGTAEKPFNPQGEPKTVHQVIQAQFTALNKHDPATWSVENIKATLKSKFGVDAVMQLSPDTAEALRKKLWSLLTTAGMHGDGDMIVSGN
jgi:hypothetical protein